MSDGWTQWKSTRIRIANSTGGSKEEEEREDKCPRGRRGRSRCWVWVAACGVSKARDRVGQAIVRLVLSGGRRPGSGEEKRTLTIGSFANPLEYVNSDNACKLSQLHLPRTPDIGRHTEDVTDPCQKKKRINTPRRIDLRKSKKDESRADLESLARSKRQDPARRVNTTDRKQSDQRERERVTGAAEDPETMMKCHDP